MSTPLEIDAPKCLYTTTAVTPIFAPELTANIHVDGLVVGGGYTGLSTALHLAERNYVTALLEAREPGFAAAGRNGGQVNAGLCLCRSKPCNTPGLDAINDRAVKTPFVSHPSLPPIGGSRSAHRRSASSAPARPRGVKAFPLLRPSHRALEWRDQRSRSPSRLRKP